MDEVGAHKALHAFGVTPLRITCITRQHDRAVWRVSSPRGPLALKCLASRQRPRKIARVSEYLHERGVPVIVPLPTTDGERFVRIGDSTYMLFPWGAGERPRYEDFSLTAPMAALMARFHEASHGYVAGGGPTEDRLAGGWHKMKLHLEWIHEKILTGADPFSQICREVLPWVETRLDWVTDRHAQNPHLQALIREAQRSPHLVHGDYSAVNLLADRDGNLTIIDLDEVCTALPVWELSRFISWMNHDSIGWSGSRFETALEAYRQVRPFSAAEEEILRTDLVYPRQAVSLMREYYAGAPNPDGVRRIEGCIAADLEMMRYLGISLKGGQRFEGRV